MISHRVSSHLNLKKYYPGIGKWETRFPNHVINRGSQQSGSATECNRVRKSRAMRTNAKRCKATCWHSSGNNLFIFGHRSLHMISTFFNVPFDKWVLSKLRNKSLVFLLREFAKGRALWHTRACYTNLGETHANLDSSSFRCSIALLLMLVFNVSSNVPSP